MNSYCLATSMDLYKLLEIQRGADAGEIRKSYMRLVKTHHPDKGGDEEYFKKIQKAFEVLSDENARQMYDMTGQVPGDGPQPSMQSGPPGGFPGFAFDIGNLFGMFGPHMSGTGGQRRKGLKAPPKVEHVQMTLGQFYHGNIFQVCLDRHKFCNTCNGEGAKKKETCGICNGSGSRQQVINMNGMTMHSRGPCNGCTGKGFRIVEKCDTCNGNCKISEKKTLEAKIAPGTQAGETLVFQEACSEVPEFEKAGDLHIIVDQAPESNGWKRAGEKGNDLEIGLTLSLAESLVGCVTRLNGHPAYDDGLFITIPPASFTGDIYCISGLGMPIKGQTGLYGDLYIRVQVSVKLTERRILASEAGQRSIEDLFKGLCHAPDGYEEGKTEVQKGAYLART